jgi:hypothetical protein
MQVGKEEDQQKWLMEGHGAGLCLSMVAHTWELLHNTIILEEAETQTNNATTQTTPAPACVDVSVQATPTTDKIASQTNDHEQWTMVCHPSNGATR